MNMNKNWMKLPNRTSAEYANGVEEFIGFAKQKLDSKGMAKCPCDRCNNKVDKRIADVRKDLLDYGMDKTYTHWHHHGEEYEVLSDDDDYDEDDEVGEPEDIMWLHGMLQEWEKRSSVDNLKLFESLLSKAQQPSYPGSKKFSVLEFLVNLYNIKITNRWSDESIDGTLELTRDALPVGCTLPKSHNEAKILLGNLYLGLTLLPSVSVKRSEETVKAVQATMAQIMVHFDRSLAK